MDTLVVVCLLGDPTLPAVSVKHTGGFQVDIQELLYNTNKSSCVTHIITNTSQYCDKLFEKKDNYYIHRIPFENSWLDDQNLLMENIEYIKTSFFNILNELNTGENLIHSFYWLSGIVAYEAKKKYNINYVHSVVSLAIGKILSGSSPYFSKQFEYEKAFLERASMIFSITETEKEQLEEYYGTNSNKIVVVGRDVHPAFLHPSHIFDGTPEGVKNAQTGISPLDLLKCPWWMQGAYTFIGRIQIIKGLHHILSAWIKLYKKYGDVTPPLWICGGAPESISNFRIELEEYIDIELLEECERKQKIVWWGYLDPAGLSTIMLKTRVLVTHSLYEPGGRVLLEAFAASVPVIATPNGFANDMIQNNDNGFLVEYGNINDLSLAMEYFMNDDISFLSMKERARETYLKQHKKWDCYKKHFAVYQQLGLNSFDEKLLDN